MLQTTLPTPPKVARDQFIDLIRAFGTCAIILLHWLLIQATLEGHTLTPDNALDRQWGWTLTMLLNTVPLMFFAAGAGAGFSHLQQKTSKSQKYITFLRKRIARLAPAPLALASFWTLLLFVSAPFTNLQQPVWLAARTVVQPLWFVAVLLVLASLTPILIWGAKKYYYQTLLVLIVASVLFEGSLLTIVSIWGIAYYLGIGFSMRKFSQLTLTLKAAICITLTLVLVIQCTFLTYSPFMIGVPSQNVSNMAPPNLVMLTFATLQIALTITFAPHLTKLSQHKSLTHIINWLNTQGMRCYVWHLSAAFMVVGLTLFVAHQTMPTPWSLPWLATRPIWLALCSAFLIALVKLSKKLEHSLFRTHTATGLGSENPAFSERVLSFRIITPCLGAKTQVKKNIAVLTKTTVPPAGKSRLQEK